MPFYGVSIEAQGRWEKECVFQIEADSEEEARQIAEEYFEDEEFTYMQEDYKGIDSWEK